MEQGLPFEHLRIDEGWFAGYLGPVQCVYYGRQITQASFDRYLAYLGQEIDARPPGRRNAVLYEIPEPATMAATQRKAIAEVLAIRREKLRTTVSAYALVTGSLFVRSIMQTIVFFAPPPVACNRLYITGRSLALERIGEWPAK